ncbi:serine/threonine-protein kinase 31 isoform X2 [Amia ocellicauda]|uniref:serine/threonine-protein kinase 31 isoform X2 n=1 Tax=Amia ocellicauda TaxID=2972642 RepID=UPI003464B9BD
MYICLCRYVKRRYVVCCSWFAKHTGDKCLIRTMDESETGKMELIGVTYVLDAVTFWAQNVNDDNAVKKMSSLLSETCPTARRVLGNPSPQKLYGALFSEDKCWYRCKVQMHKDDQFHVTYIDYGNSEVVSRSALVELPEELQMTSFAQKYRFWGFHVVSNEDSPHFLQGKTFLNNLIFGKKLRIQKMSVCRDGTVLVQAFQGNLDIGEELAKMKFITVDLPGADDCQKAGRILREACTLWTSRVPERGQRGDELQGYMPKLRPAFLDQKPQPVREKSTITTLQPANSLKKKMDKELLEENEKLRAEKSALEQNLVLTEAQLQNMKTELQKVKERSQKDIEVTEKLLKTAVGDKLRRVAQKAEAVRRVRENSNTSSLGDNLLEAINVVTLGCISAPATMDKVNAAWQEYHLAQEKLRACRVEKDELEVMVGRRDEVRSALAGAVEEYLAEVDKLPIAERGDNLEELGSALSSVFGSFSMEDVGENAFDQFAEWKSRKQQEFNSVRNKTDDALKSLCLWFSDISKFFYLKSGTSVTLSEIADNIDRVLEKVECDICKELEVSLATRNDQDIKVVTNAYYRVMQKIQQEQSLLFTVREKYMTNTEFKKEFLQWQDETPKADVLFAIKKVIKALKSQLRWKLAEMGNLEEAEEPDAGEILKKKEEITEIRNTLFQEINREREEYRKLALLTKKLFPELPLLYPSLDILSYMNSNGLVTKSLERDLFDAEPMRELSSKRPLVCTEFQGQKVILKGYSVDDAAEARVLERAAQYHQAFCNASKYPGLLPLLSLFFGKSDPLAYVIMPNYTRGSLRVIQGSSPLTGYEIPKVMKGVAVGLQTLHCCGITHGALHPNNVFVLNRECGVVGDFDFTKTAEQRALVSWMVAGDLSLAAPEVRTGRPASSACDMYAFGGVLLWLHFPNGTFVTKADGTPDTRGLDMDPKLQALLGKLLTCSGRLTALEVMSDDYFLEADVPGPQRLEDITLEVKP